MNQSIRSIIVFVELGGTTDRVEQRGQPIGRRVRDGAPLASARRRCPAARAPCAAPALRAAAARLPASAPQPPLARGAAQRVREPSDGQRQRARLHGPVLPTSAAAIRSSGTCRTRSARAPP